MRLREEMLTRLDIMEGRLITSLKAMQTELDYLERQMHRIADRVGMKLEQHPFASAPLPLDKSTSP